MSLPEGLLWRELRKRPSGLKFRRQHPAGIYVLDFYCAAARLAIEVDGRHMMAPVPPVRIQGDPNSLGRKGLRRCVCQLSQS
jgi:hypothetical protein